LHGFVIKEQLSSIEDNHSIDNLTHCTFAASVRPNECHDFSGLHIQMAVGQGYNPTVVFNDV
jgi:hypothetical protein